MVSGREEGLSAEIGGINTSVCSMQIYHGHGGMVIASERQGHVSLPSPRCTSFPVGCCVSRGPLMHNKPSIITDKKRETV